jgi:hypothetical protein
MTENKIFCGMNLPPKRLKLKEILLGKKKFKKRRCKILSLLFMVFFWVYFLFLI